MPTASGVSAARRARRKLASALFSEPGRSEVTRDILPETCVGWGCARQALPLSSHIMRALVEIKPVMAAIDPSEPPTSAITFDWPRVSA